MAGPDDVQQGLPAENVPSVVPVPIYTPTELQKELRQSEIITNFIQHIYRPEIGDAVATTHPYVIVLSQDCDLLREFEKVEKAEAGVFNGVLIYEAEPAENVKLRNPGIAKRIRQNKDERFQFLEAAPPELDLRGEGLPELVIDFRRFFTVPSQEIHRQLKCPPPNSAQRRCRLEMPYREHLQCRAAFYMQRVMLPRDHGQSP